MDVPNALKAAIERQVSGLKQKQLVEDAKNISLKYRTQSGQGKRLVSSQDEVLAYSVVRMPATYGAVCSALQHSLTALDCQPVSLLDVGAGTGAASWAAASLLELENIVCFEREPAMCDLGKSLMEEAAGQLNCAQWVCGDVLKDTLPVRADLVIASYVFNEMTEQDRLVGLGKLWEATGTLLLLVEPGTPEGYAGIMQARNFLLEQGGKIAAPCPHQEPCPLEEADWCHFACRVPRSRLHREIKGGEAPYEDEKYAYLAIFRSGQPTAQARVVRHPYIEKGRVTLKLCTKDGLKQMKITKKDPLYKQARKAKWGDTLVIKDQK